MIKNPLDAHPILLEPEKLMAKTMDILYAAKNIHMVIISLHLDWLDTRFISKIAEALKTICPKHLKEKPFAVCWRQTRLDPEIIKESLDLEKDLLDAGIPVYQSFEYAADALAKFAGYHGYIDHKRIREEIEGTGNELKLAS
jgi:hypothetical protein